MNRNLDKRVVYFWGTYLLFQIVLLFVAIGWGTGIILSKMLTIIAFGMYVFKKNEPHMIDFEKVAILFFVTLFNILLLFRGKMQGYNEIFNIFCSILLVLMAVIYIVRYHKGVKIKKWFSENAVILLIILSFAVMSIEVIDAWLMWDARIFYSAPFGGNDVRTIIKNFDADFMGTYNLFLGSHASIGYTLWIVLFQLFKEGTSSLQIADIVLAGISIFAFYQILRKILGDRFGNGILALATIPYAFSPFVLGMIGDFNLDSATMYFMVIFLACLMYHFEALELIFAFCFCFSKEPAIIYYTFYIIAKVVCEYLYSNSFNLLKLMKFGFGNIKNYIYALPVVLWKVLSSLNDSGGWGDTSTSLWGNEGFNCFGISPNVISMKLKQIALLNFNWIFWGTIILSIIIYVVRKSRVDKQVSVNMYPICFMGAVIIVFGCLYVTWTHARYIAPLIPIIYLVAIVIVATICLKKEVFYIWSTILSILLLLQSFDTIDPVMKKAFHSVVIGNTKINSMQLEGNQRISDDKLIMDSIVYNRQYIYWQEILNEVLNAAGYDGNMLIVLPNDPNSENFAFFGEAISLWNTEEGRLEYYNVNLDSAEDSRQIVSSRPWEAVEQMNSANSDNILYIIPGWADIDMDFVSDKKIIRQGEVSNKGYKVKYIVMNIDYNMPLSDGEYSISPQLNSSLSLGTDGSRLCLKEASSIHLSGFKTKYEFMFNEYQMTMDVPSGRVDENGSVQVWQKNDTDSQRWFIENINGYYMLSWHGYALTYDLNDNSVKLTPKTGADSQLWTITN